MSSRMLLKSIAATLALFASAGQATTHAQQTGTIPTAAQDVAVAPQYDTTHVYVAPENVDRFVSSFLGTFGGKSTKQVVATVTPTPSSTSSQLLQTPVGTVSLFGFKTPIPFPFGTERNGLLVTDLDAATALAKDAGADVLVAPFPDPIGRDVVIQFPGGVNTQLYWHFTAPSYTAFETVPENRVYVSPLRVVAFLESYLAFSKGRIVSDENAAAGVSIGRPADTFRRVRIESKLGKVTVFVTDGHLPYPWGHEMTGYEVADLAATLTKARANGVTVLVDTFKAEDRQSAIVQFPGGYIAEIHSILPH